MRKPDLSPGNLRWRLANGRVHASNAWYRAAGRRISGARAGIRSRRNRRAIVRGRTSGLERWAWQARSKVPVYRSRINPATGRPHRDDAHMARTRDQGLQRLRQRITQVSERHPAFRDARPRSAQQILDQVRDAQAREPQGRTRTHFRGGGSADFGDRGRSR